jgi:hypothetical protein
MKKTQTKAGCSESGRANASKIGRIRLPIPLRKQASSLFLSGGAVAVQAPEPLADSSQDGHCP